jgi:hypothetical protein
LLPVIWCVVFPATKSRWVPGQSFKVLTPGTWQTTARQKEERKQAYTLFCSEVHGSDPQKARLGFIPGDMKWGEMEIPARASGNQSQAKR